MNVLLIFFALPIAVIIFSIILQKIFKCPIIVAAIIFAIFLIVTFVVNNLNILVATIAYTLLSFITAYIVMLLCRINWNHSSCCNSCSKCNCNCNTCNNNCQRCINDITTVSLSDNNVINSNQLLNSSNCPNNNENRECFNGTYNIGRNGTTCTCSKIDNNTIAVSANICPNTNGRSGRFFGTYR